MIVWVLLIRKQLYIMISEQLKVLQDTLNYKFKNIDLLRQAVTHKSFSLTNNERLEFLGDSVLNYAISSLIFFRDNSLNEGQLSRIRANLINNETLFKIASSIDLKNCIRTGSAFKKKNFSGETSIIANSMEAVFGAICIDSDFSVAKRIIISLYDETILNKVALLEVDKRDAKGELQELLQAKGYNLPKYEVVTIFGPEHEPTYEVRCKIEVRSPVSKEDVFLVAKGKSSSIKMAERKAAEAVLSKFKISPES